MIKLICIEANWSNFAELAENFIFSRVVFSQYHTWKLWNVVLSSLNVHFRSFSSYKHVKQNSAETVGVTCVHSDTDSQWNAAAVAKVWKRENFVYVFLFFFFLKRFTMSPRPPRHGYITANMWKMRQETIDEREKTRGEGRKGDDVRPFILTKEEANAYQHRTFFFLPQMPRRWTAAAVPGSDCRRCGKLALFGNLGGFKI